MLFRSEVPPEIFAEPATRLRYRALCDAARLLTDAPSTARSPARHGESTLCFQMAKRLGVPHLFYEVNNGTAGAHVGARRGIAVLRAALAAMSAD